MQHFENPNEAKMAQANLDGVDFEGVKLKVEVICHIDKMIFKITLSKSMDFVPMNVGIIQ